MRRATGLAAIAALLGTLGAAGHRHLPALMSFPNEAGEARTYSTAGPLDLANPFFLSLGTNGRQSTCATCHNVPNAGSHAGGGFFNLGLSDESQRPPDLPLYTLRCLTTGKEIRTTDPGRALVTGRCADIGKFKVPTLRALATRAPYFHNGAAATLDAVIDVYERRFVIGLTPAERADLVAFLRAL